MNHHEQKMSIAIANMDMLENMAKHLSEGDPTRQLSESLIYSLQKLAAINPILS